MKHGDTNLIGYWMASLQDEDFCAPQELRGELASTVASTIADYLDSGIEVANYLGYSWCRYFCGASDSDMGSRELSDGVWSWPEGLSHYVRDHSVALPEEFIEHALTNGSHGTRDDGIIPTESDYRPSLKFWKKWCATQRSPLLAKRLHKMRADADARALSAERNENQQMVQELIDGHGLGDDACIWTGCEEKALADMKVCAQHSLGDVPSIAASNCYLLTPELLTQLLSEKKDAP